MECDRAREAISARIDGEDPGVPDGALEAHLAGCDACQAWQQRAHALTRRARLGGPFLDHDLTGPVLAALPAAPGRGRLRLALRAALLALSLGQLAVTVPLLILGHDPEASTHAAHELGSFDLALAIAFAVGAVRPTLSAGLAWTCAIAAGGLAGTAIADLIGGQTFGADEAQHLIAVAGALLLIWQARISRTGVADAGTADGTDWPQEALSSRAAEPGDILRLAARRQSPGDGAARVTAPDTGLVTQAADVPEAAPVSSTPSGVGPAPVQVGPAPGRDDARPARPGRDGDDAEAVA
ncbi:MAG TPA: zf-HC2 domain-containing protein [Trebonia sp.]|jgi:predicted anti-sigma-YlaC factor YlaD